MKKNAQSIVSVILIVAAAAVFIVFDAVKITFTQDETVNALLLEIIPRLTAGAVLIAVLVIWGCKSVLTPSLRELPRALLWCLPCFLVVIANFPFTAIFGGSAKILRADLIALFLLKCLAIGLMEEMLFRGLVQDTVARFFENKRYGNLITVAVTSAIFALVHLLNLIAGANVGATFLQIGYSFLIGAMLSAVLIKTRNIWLCVILHTLFDFGGLIVTDLGTGSFQDMWFWVFTAVAGVLCFVHVLYFLLKQPQPENG